MISLDDDAADAVFNALSSETARSILTALYTQPRTASELAAETETSVQNVAYHLDRLRTAELVEVVDTWYSDQGTEMKVYAPTNEALVLFGGEDVESDSLLAAIKRLVGALTIITGASLVVDTLVRQSSTAYKVANVTVGTPRNAATPVESVVSPGLLFFGGCVFALGLVTIWASVRAD